MSSVSLVYAFAALAIFTVAGRIAGLILFVLTLISCLLLFIVYLDTREPLLVNLLIVCCVLIVCLMKIKTRPSSKAIFRSPID